MAAVGLSSQALYDQFWRKAAISRSPFLQTRTTGVWGLRPQRVQGSALAFLPYFRRCACCWRSTASIQPSSLAVSILASSRAG